MTIEDYFTHQRKLKPSSVRAYMTVLKKLNNNELPLGIDFLVNYHHVFEYIEKFKLTTQRSYIITVVQALKSVMGYDDVKDIYETKLAELDYLYNTDVEEYQKSDTQAENMLSMDELKLVADFRVAQLKDIDNVENIIDIYEIYKNAIITLLYTEIPSIRLEYSSMEIIFNDNDIKPNKNYLLVEPHIKSFILQDYKTSRKYHEKVFHPTKKLSKLLDEWIELNPSNYLFVNKEGSGAVKANTFQSWIPKAFEPSGKKITLNTIRHIWISDNVDYKILEKNAELADAMGHSPATQKNYIKI
jgi:hypothetical protein